ELAEQGRKPILPLRIDVSDPVGGLKYMLANKQWVERTALGNRLVDHIQSRLAGTRPLHVGADPVERPAAAASPKKSAGSAVIIAAAAAVCVVIGFGAVAFHLGWLSKPAALGPGAAVTPPPGVPSPPASVAVAPTQLPTGPAPASAAEK